MNDNVKVSFKDGFRIMQLTDLHLVRTGDGPEQRELDMIRNLIALERPDFVAVTGDLSLSDTSDCCYRVFCDFMDGFGIPWAYAMGNDNGMLRAMQEKGDMRGVFVGHDHVNDFAGMYNGILLAYGRGSCNGEQYIGGIKRGGYIYPGYIPGCRMIVLQRDGFETYVRLEDGTLLYKD